MSFVLNWKLWLLVALLALGPLGYWKGRIDGKRIVTLEWKAATAQANSEARRLEQRRQDRANEAAKLAAVRESRIRADAVRARNAASGLRNDLDAIERASAESLAAANNAVRVLGDVFEQCVREYSSVAEAADRATSEVKQLRDAWPR